MHIIPMEHPNRRFPTPPPFVWHPDLFPKLSQNNPEPSNFEIPAPSKSKKKKNKDRTMLSKEPSAFSVLPKDNFEHRFKMPSGYGVPFLRNQVK